jgi:hypothetical protein
VQRKKEQLVVYSTPAGLMFLVLFFKKNNSVVFFLWGQPQTPWLRFAEIVELPQG